MMQIKDIYKSCNENERFGFAFGLFPIRLQHLDKDACVKLIQFSKKEFKAY